MKHQWTERPRPARLERRVELPDYAATRRFLDAAAVSCERAGIYPDISFGRTYVNMTLVADAEILDAAMHGLAAELDALIPQTTTV